MPAEQTEAKPLTLRSTNDQEAGRFYASVLRALNDDHVPFLVAGTYALTGTYTEDISAAGGTGCALFLGTNGGPFAQLPCRVAYTITGTTPR